MTITKQDIAKLYQAELARLGDQPDRELHAFRGTRTRVHEALQTEAPPPAPNAGEDSEDHHHRQKRYGKALWRRADLLVADAGITEKGRVS